MSFLPPDLLPGDPAVGGMLISAGPTQPFFAPASGGGGGGAGPNPSVSTLSFAQSGQILMSTVLNIYDQAVGSSFDFWAGQSLSTFASVAGQPCSGVAIYSPNADGQLNVVSADDGTNWITTYGSGPTGTSVSTLNVVADNVVMSSLTVSSINGASPGGGASLFTSSFSLACPGQASTLVMEMPAGQYAYQGECLFTGAKAFLSGRLSAIYNVTATQWSANFEADNKGNNDPADTQPNIEMTINYGRNPLSTVQLLVANNNTAGTGDCTWVGAVGKLY